MYESSVDKISFVFEREEIDVFFESEKAVLECLNRIKELWERKCEKSMDVRKTLVISLLHHKGN